MGGCRILLCLFYMSLLWTHRITYHYGMFLKEKEPTPWERAPLYRLWYSHNDNGAENWVNLAKKACPQSTFGTHFTHTLSHIYGIPDYAFLWSNYGPSTGFTEIVL